MPWPEFAEVDPVGAPSFFSRKPWVADPSSKASFLVPQSPSSFIIRLAI